MSDYQGVVKFYNSAKGFGFLKEEKSGTEYFVHATGLQDTIYENDKVSFELTEGKKGKIIATNVKVIE
jgi:CspA family cold shock protein